MFILGDCEISGFLRRKLGASLYCHSRGVSEMAGSLARFYDVDESAARKAGLWHDYGKSFTFASLKRKAKMLGFPPDHISLTSPQLLHAPVGAMLLFPDVGIADIRIIRAVYYHTTGSAGLGLLEKIVYLADAIEENRSYPGVKVLRRLAFIDFERALLKVLDNTIKRVLAQNAFLHPDSVAFRNEIIRG